ncbi:hypothetical protein [Caballeronia sp. LZ032]|uniref:hypothetical protein n=1 Tax=Caballeronia sp. LZ032 TaxID=3038565 RepID=UPI00286380DF|nr:hypothetical protein [Caballeronia sp. LZ032]MDR5879013.1 hypothetical protein [Caballeronia sp. LZ032]
MPAGLQIRNDSNVLQVDGVNQHMVLLRAGVMTTGHLASGRTDIASSMATVAQNNGEILAIQAGGAGFSIAGRYGGVTTVYFQGIGEGTLIAYWVFGPYTPSGVNYGMLIRDVNNVPIWDTGRPPMRVVQTVSGLGTFTVGVAGKTYALAAVTQYGKLERSGAGLPGQPGNQNLLQTFTTGYGAISGQTVTIQNSLTIGGVYGPVSSSQIPAGWGGVWDNQQQNTYTVLDVTNY